MCGCVCPLVIRPVGSEGADESLRSATQLRAGPGPCFVECVSVPELIDLGRGHPDPSLLPAEHLQRVGGLPVSLGALSYTRPGGRRSFIAALARFVEASTGVSVPQDNLLMTSGASHGLDLAAAALARPGDTVIVEAPTYFHALGLLRGRGLNIEAVPVDDEGIQVDALEALLQRVRPAFVYTIPVFHNPAGVTASPDRRRALIKLAEAHDFYVVADEVYQLLSFGPPPPAPLRTFGPKRVVSLSSFSKILAPGLRLGWVEAELELLAKLADDGALQSGGGVSPWTQALIRPLLEEGVLLEIVKELQAGYQLRAEALDEGLRAALGPQAKLRKPDGGYFSWVELPRGIQAQDLLPVARTHGVSFLPGPRCAASGGLESHVRLGFSLYSPEVLRIGAQRLGRAVDELG